MFDDVVRPFDHTKVYGEVPPVALAVADPLIPALQLTLVLLIVVVIALG